MTTIHLDTEIVATSFDKVRRVASYTIQRGDQRWTVSLPEADLNKHGANKKLRQTMVATALNNAMQGKPDHG
jgi:hypothetical protein